MRTLVLLTVALLAACGPTLPAGSAGEAVTLRVEPDEAAAGEAVSLTLRNGSPGAIGYNLCTSGLERRAASGWEPVPSERVCTMELRTVSAGQEAPYPMELPASLAPGEYRFVTTVEILDTGTRRDVRSGSFRVER